MVNIQAVHEQWPSWQRQIESFGKTYGSDININIHNIYGDKIAMLRVSMGLAQAHPNTQTNMLLVLELATSLLNCLVRGSLFLDAWLLCRNLVHFHHKFDVCQEDPHLKVHQMGTCEVYHIKGLSQ